MFREKKFLYDGMLEGLDLINYFFKRWNLLKLCDFIGIFIIYRVIEYIVKNIGFLCLILVIGCYLFEINVIVYF